MKYSDALIEGHFLRRYKRFFADVELTENGKKRKVVAHVANTGSLRDICDSEAPCRVAYHADPNRKLKYSLEQVKTPTSWVGVNTSVANKLVAEAFETKLWQHWSHLKEMKKEHKISDKTRLDFRFSDAHGKFHFVEVKNVSMADQTLAQFPDAETTRGQKHLEELIDLIALGHTAELVFVVQRTDTQTFAAAAHIDARYAELLLKARAAGVVISPFSVKLTTRGAEISCTPLKLAF